MPTKAKRATKPLSQDNPSRIPGDEYDVPLEKLVPHPLNRAPQIDPHNVKEAKDAAVRAKLNPGG